MTRRPSYSVSLPAVFLSLVIFVVPISPVLAASVRCSLDAVANYSSLPSCQASRCIGAGGSCLDCSIPGNCPSGSGPAGGGPTGGGSTGNPFAPGGVQPFPHNTPPPASGPVSSVDSALYVIVWIVELAQVAFWIFAAGFGLYAAYLYLFSGGNKEAIGNAKKMLIYTVVASLLAVISYGIPAIVYNFAFP